MNAQEARLIAIASNTDAVNSQYAKIKKQIEDSAKNGEYDTYVYDYIKPDVRKKLESEGFTVGTTGSFRNETTTQISW